MEGERFQDNNFNKSAGQLAGELSKLSQDKFSSRWKKLDRFASLNQYGAGFGALSNFTCTYVIFEKDPDTPELGLFSFGGFLVSAGIFIYNGRKISRAWKVFEREEELRTEKSQIVDLLSNP